MLKLNKCRALHPFNEAILASLLPQSQSSETQAGTNLTETQQQTQQTEVSQENQNSNKKNDQNFQNKKQTPSKQNDDKGITTENKEEKIEAEKSQENQTQYLFFELDDFIITTYMNETGWWYGYKDLGGPLSTQPTLGYFPSNYVQVIEEYEQENYAQIEAEALKESANLDEAFTWNDYAKYSYLDDNKILIDERTKKLNDPTAPENRNQEGIMGYKKIKIHESRSHAVNPSKGGKVQTSQIAVKDQSPAAKAYRQMNHYFDYDAWIEERNKNPAPKAKADPTKKKNKPKVLNW